MNNKRFILGTVQFGVSYGINNSSGKPSRSKVFDILYRACQSGIDQLDSAGQYGDAHQIIGDFISSGKGEFLVNSKFVFGTGASIREQLQTTLAQLNTGAVNIYFYHRFDEMLQYPESLKELVALKETGSIKKTGVSIYTNEEFEASIHEPFLDVIQIPFNLLDNFSRRGALIQKAKEKGKEIQVRSVFLQGLFFKDGNSFPDVLKPLTPYIDQLERIAKNLGMSMEELALGYVAGHTEIDGIIVGVDSVEQLEKNLSFFQTTPVSDITDQVGRIVVKEEHLLYPYNWK